MSSGPTYMANIHHPTFQRLPKSFYLNETDPVGTEVFKVRDFDIVSHNLQWNAHFVSSSRNRI
jgi:hypothetical protein